MRLLPFILALALAGAGCAKSAAKVEQQAQRENSRAVEERRLRQVDGRDIGSKRGAEVLIYDPNKTFDSGRSPLGSRRGYDARGARVKEFAYDQKVNPRTYNAGDFNGSKSAWVGGLKYSTTEANTRGNYSIPNAETKAATKTAATREAPDSDKLAATRALPSGNRPFLGRESEKMNTALDQNNLPRTSNELHELKTVEDVRELLNKNK